MYLRYFGLDEAPFSITPDPAFVYLSPRHRDALAHLLYGVGKGGSAGFVQLTGEVGTGKTTICRYMLEQVPDGTHIALILNPMLSPLELLAAISEELGIETGSNHSSARLLVDGLNDYLLEAHARGEQVVVVIDEAQNLSQEALEQVRLLTNLETSKEKLLQIVLLGQPELRDLLHRRSLRQLAQRITARYHLNPLGRADTGLYVDHRLRVAGAERNPFRSGAVKALYQRSQGIPRLINIIADRALLSAFSSERAEVTGSMVHEAADEVQLGERQIRRRRWPWLAAALVVLVLEVMVIGFFRHDPGTVERAGDLPGAPAVALLPEQVEDKTVQQPVTEIPPEKALEPAMESVGPEPPGPEPGLESAGRLLDQVDRVWLQNHQGTVWQGMASEWRDVEAATSVQSACDGNDTLGYACLRDQGNWSKIRNLGLPVILVLRGEPQSYLLLRGMDGQRLLIGASGEQLTVSRQAVEDHWLGAYMVVWPQAEAWPAIVVRGDTGPAVTTIMEMAARDEVPYHGGQVFDAAFERWLRNFQMRNGLAPDGIVGRKTLLHLMTSSIEEPRLFTNWEN